MLVLYDDITSAINQSIIRWIFDEMKIEQEEEREAGKTNKKEKVEKR